MLDINYTLFIQIANFLFLLVLLNIILFRPIRRILTQRNEETNSLEKTIEDYQNRSEQNEKDIEENKVLARKDGYAARETIKGQGLEEERRILQETNSSAEEKIGIAKSEIESKIDDVRKALEDQVASFSKELSEKILGRSIQ